MSEVRLPGAGEQRTRMRDVSRECLVGALTVDDDVFTWRFLASEWEHEARAARSTERRRPTLRGRLMRRDVTSTTL